MQPNPDQALLPAQQAPVHARPQRSEHSLSGLPSFQEMAAGLAHAGESLLVTAFPFCPLLSLLHHCTLLHMAYPA